MKLTTTLPTLALVAMLATACTGGTEPVETPTPTVTATPSPSPSPAVDPDGIQEQSDPELGIVFEDVPELTGDEADVYDTVALFEKAYWLTMKTNEVHPSFDVLASPEVRDQMSGIAAQNASIGARIGGTFVSTIRDIAIASEGEATASACSDYRSVTFADSEREYTPAEAEMGEPELNVLTLRKLDATWQVATNEYAGPC